MPIDLPVTFVDASHPTRAEKANMHLHSAQHYLSRQLLDHAIEEYEAALRYAPLNLSLYREIAVVYVNAGKQREAEARLSRGCLVALGQQDQVNAEALLHTLQSIAPENRSIRFIEKEIAELKEKQQKDALWRIDWNNAMRGCDDLSA